METINNIIKKAKGESVFDDISHINMSSSISQIIDDLKEDLLQIQYPHNLILDVGWYPEFNIEGAFIICIVKNSNWEKPFFKKKAKDLKTLITVLEEAIQICNELGN